MKSDLQLARAVKLKRIDRLAKGWGIRAPELEPHGEFKARVRLEILDRLRVRKDGRLVVVTAITPTPLGEGKTVTTIGLSMGIARLGRSVFTCLRQPSMGPVFGIKGGAAGGGLSQVVPMEDFNLHLTGDIHAIAAAHNLGAAALDSRLFHEEHLGPEVFAQRTGLRPLGIDPAAIEWRRVVDVNDRALREIEIGLPAPGAATNDNGIPRRTGFDIAVASELMAILALAKNLHDLRRRIGRIVMARDRGGQPVTAEDIGVAGAMTVVLRDAIRPTLMQTMEGTPCFVHAGPFANIAHGNSSIVADRVALKLADYVVTEAGFGADMGFEKFCNIKTRISGLKPRAAVVVATLRALKMHSGRYKVSPGRPLDPGLVSPNREALDAGFCNLERHLQIVAQHGLPAVVAVNRFPGDTAEELDHVCRRAREAGAFDAVVSEVHARGGAGGGTLARAVVRACDTPARFRFRYPATAPLREKIETLAKTVYRAASVDFSPRATEQIARLEAEDHGKLPVCMAKTHLSLSHDPSLKGAPEGFVFPVREVRLSAGAGFVYVLAGAISTMPGFGSKPGYLKLDIDRHGEIVGLS
ncbi:MAG: formate--tetrahydrofolate ligase [Verrucomicrobia bacterium]|nr:formate--tetrahydrofolate ligase [Verrucomicrobiota bacterium]